MSKSSKRERADRLHALMKKISAERGIEYLGDQPDHPIYKRGYTIVSGGYTPTSKNGTGVSKATSNSSDCSGTAWTGEDADRFCPGLDDAGRARWVAVAEVVEGRCLEDGGSREECAAKGQQAATNACKERKQ